jgi:tRNA threonylcarbamoyladenosine biosynthesis protein TsaE
MGAELSSRSEAETLSVARELAAGLQPGAVVLLSGDLGAGKTVFVRGLAEGLGADPSEVTSPTFTLLQEYRGGRIPLYHADLYRLSDPREIDELGLGDLSSDGVLAVEWSDKLPRAMPGAIEVAIEHRDDRERSIRISNR